MSAHFIKKCYHCQTVLGQCRCPSTTKEIQWGSCEGCPEVPDLAADLVDVEGCQDEGDAEDWREFFRNGIETIAGQRYEIKRLNDRIKSLEEGECRFHCRVRADMWKAGFAWEQEHWPGLHRATPEQITEQYDLWRNQHDTKDTA